MPPQDAPRPLRALDDSRPLRPCVTRDGALRIWVPWPPTAREWADAGATAETWRIWHTLDAATIAAAQRAFRAAVADDDRAPVEPARPESGRLGEQAAGALPAETQAALDAVLTAHRAAFDALGDR